MGKLWAISKHCTLWAELDRPNLAFLNVALLRLDEPFTAKDIEVVKINEYFDANSLTNKATVISGWGSLFIDGPPQEILQKASLRIQGDAMDGHVLVFDNEGGIGGCTGDSGGQVHFVSCT